MLLQQAFFFGGGVMAFQYLEKSYFKLPQMDVAEEVSKHFNQAKLELGLHPAAPLWGNPQGAVTLVEYSDFQCSYCRLAAFHLRGLLWEFRDDVRLYFMNYPLDKKINRYIGKHLHEHAGLAARAALSAQQRGKFWEFHDDLFRGQENLGEKMILNLAEKYGWDRDGFEKSIDSPEIKQRLLDEIDYAGAAVPSTPTLIVNGRRIVYWNHPEIVKTIVRKEILRAKKIR